MGLSWQQGPLAPGAVGHFLTDQPLPDRLLFAEPARRRMRIRFDDTWIADSEEAILLHEPGHYPVAYLPIEHVEEGVLLPTDRTTTHRDLGATRWFTVAGPGRRAERAAWTHTDLPEHAAVLAGHVAFAWRAMDGFYEEDERILGHAADNYHRVDIRSELAPPRRPGGRNDHRRHDRTRRALRIRVRAALVCAPSRHRRDGTDRDTDQHLLPLQRASPGTTASPGSTDAAWSYRDAFPEAGRVDGLVPGRRSPSSRTEIDVFLDGERSSGSSPGRR